MAARGHRPRAPLRLKAPRAASYTTRWGTNGDRAYDSDAILAEVTAQGAVPVIPPHPVRSGPRPTDWHLYKERARIECLGAIADLGG